MTKYTGKCKRCGWVRPKGAICTNPDCVKQSRSGDGFLVNPFFRRLPRGIRTQSPSKSDPKYQYQRKDRFK